MQSNFTCIDQSTHVIQFEDNATSKHHYSINIFSGGLERLISPKRNGVNIDTYLYKWAIIRVK